MRYPCFVVQNVLVLLCSTTLLTAQEKAVTPEAALQEAARILVQGQESYNPDRPVGRLSEDRLKEWQDEERVRLEKLRSRKKPGVEWPYEGVYRVRGGVIPPGYRVGGSAIVCSALVLTPGFIESKERKDAVTRSIQFMLEELENNPLLEAGPKTGYDVRGWAHAYALDFFLLALRQQVAGKKLQAEIKKMIPHLILCLATNEVKGSGGWNYAGNSCSPFMTGSTLLALYQARAQGFDVDDGMVERALAALEKARVVETGAYVYSGRTGARSRSSRRAALPGASARAAIAELCLYRAGRSDQQKLRVAVDAFFEHWDELLKRKSQQGTHKGAYGIAPYYFMYGHTYAALAIESLPQNDRPALREKMRETLWKTRDDDGGWNDRIFPRTKSYSTAMAMLALLAPKLDSVPEWKKAAPRKMKRGHE